MQHPSSEDDTETVMILMDSRATDTDIEIPKGDIEKNDKNEKLKKSIQTDNSNNADNKATIAQLEEKEFFKQLQQ